MSDQEALFESTRGRSGRDEWKYQDPIDEPKVYLRHGANDTEVEGANKAKLKSGKLRRRVYDAIRNSPEGMTDEEVEEVLGTQRTRSNRPRRKELTDMGYVRDSGRRREMDSGVHAIIWEAVEGTE